MYWLCDNQNSLLHSIHLGAQKIIDLAFAAVEAKRPNATESFTTMEFR